MQMSAASTTNKDSSSAIRADFVWMNSVNQLGGWNSFG